ncbi:hypothetical protein TNCV_1857851 [Trichonephila clavipes]|nr:hypothetical protein TNCV_1857851 [Trichonephila clavipes]
MFLRTNEIIGMMQQFKTGLSNSRVKRICKQGIEVLVTFDTVNEAFGLYRDVDKHPQEGKEEGLGSGLERVDHPKRHSCYR